MFVTPSTGVATPTFGEARGPEPAVAGQRGSLVIALAVIMVLTSLSVAVLARSLNGLRSSRQGQDTLAAQAAADAGLADALFQLDNPPGGFDVAAPLLVPGTVVPHTMTPGVTYAYRATLTTTPPSDQSTYVIVSTGRSGAMVHSVSAIAHRSPRYPFALFANHGIAFNGSSAANYAPLPSLQGIFAYTAPSVARDATRLAPIGSNHAIALASGAGGGDSQSAFAPSGSCSGCPAEAMPQGPYPTPDPPLPASPAPGPCTTLMFHVFATLYSIVPGTYVCTGDLDLSGRQLELTGPVTIYQVPLAGAPTQLNLSGLTMFSALLAPQDIPTNLQIFKSGPGEVKTDGGGRVTFIGVLYAPGSRLISTNCDLTFVGAITVDTFVCAGTGPFILAYDKGVADLLSDRWSVSDYREVPTPASL